MNMNQKIQSALENIYISPLEFCNLNCKYCYTTKTKNILSNNQILDFIEKYDRYIRSCDFFTNLNATHSPEKKNYNENKNQSKNFLLKSILFCGGEVFTLPNFPKLINTLIQKNIFVTIITNGTIDRLEEIINPNNCQLLVSFDGPKEIHDQNRGQGNFDKSFKFVQHALELGFPTEIMFLVTKDSYPFKDSFNVFNLQKTYLSDRQMSLSFDQLLDIKTNYPTYPNKDFGCFQLSLQSTGKITGCCESEISLGTITDDPQVYVSNFIKSLSPCSKCQKCNGCCDSDYFCGYKKELNKLNCVDVVQSFTK